MDLDISKDEPGVPTAGGVDVLKNTIKTSVLVNNSDTIVIGGIFKQRRQDAINGVPGLAKMPVVGRLFQRNTNVEENTEVMIFITPTIVEFNSENLLKRGQRSAVSFTYISAIKYIISYAYYQIFHR
jgi:type IV pilus assembly protein PilQ